MSKKGFFTIEPVVEITRAQNFSGYFNIVFSGIEEPSDR